MKRKFTKDVKLYDKTHIQALTDDVTLIIDRGLSYDENLPSRIYSTSITSGREIELPKIANNRTAGAFPLFVDDKAVIVGTSYRVDGDKLFMNLEFKDGGTHNVRIFVVGN